MCVPPATAALPKRKFGNDSVSPPPFLQFLSPANTLSRQKWGPGLPSGQRYWMNSSSTTAFGTTTDCLFVHTVSTILPPSSALIVFKSPSIVRRALSNAMSAYHYTVLRYVGEFSCNPLLTASKVWQDGFYQRTSLLELGLCFYIGHHHTSCSSAMNFHQILVIGLNGAHPVNVQFCACKGTPGWVEHYRQLLRIGWYPASFDRPKTAFTFDLLDTYHKLTLQGKLNLYDFYLSIMQKTDNCGQEKAIVCFPATASCSSTNPYFPQSRYHEISRCVRQWRHLKQIKRGGGAHSPTGLVSVPDGMFALECPACPHPGRNLPANWKEAPDDKKYSTLCCGTQN